MWTLAIDTAGASGSIALGNGQNIFSAALARRSYSAQLVTAADSLFCRAGTSLAALSYLAIVNGPGSFTGIRIGLSVAKAWAEVTGVKLIAISRLALCAASIAEHAEVCVVLDAGRGEWFFAHYRAHGGIAVTEALLKTPELPALASAIPLFVFEPSALSALTRFQPSLRELPTATDALAMAGSAVLASHFVDPLALDANYLRRSDAELFSHPASFEAARS